MQSAKVYDIINSKAGSNSAMQGISGLMGFPFTTIMDVAVFFTHYGPMLNDIRAVYGRTPIDKEALGHIINGCKQELLADMVLDKFVGNIPILGLPANMICAKSMTWRLGLLFGMLSSREKNQPGQCTPCRPPHSDAFPANRSSALQKADGGHR